METVGKVLAIKTADGTLARDEKHELGGFVIQKWIKDSRYLKFKWKTW